MYPMHGCGVKGGSCGRGCTPDQLFCASCELERSGENPTIHNPRTIELMVQRAQFQVAKYAEFKPRRVCSWHNRDDVQCTNSVPEGNNFCVLCLAKYDGALSHGYTYVIKQQDDLLKKSIEAFYAEHPEMKP